VQSRGFDFQEKASVASVLCLRTLPGKIVVIGQPGRW
jgi:hypothetical protein